MRLRGWKLWLDVSRTKEAAQRMEDAAGCPRGSHQAFYPPDRFASGSHGGDIKSFAALGTRAYDGLGAPGDGW